jgi:Holliday junction resolvasome RuvABC endonuclease subunit
VAKKKKKEADPRIITFEEMVPDQTALIVAVDQSSTATGHMGMLYNRHLNTEEVDDDIVLAIPEFKWLGPCADPSPKHVINSKVKSGEKVPKYWPEVSDRLRRFEQDINDMLTVYESQVTGYTVKHFVCESVYFDILHLNSATPLLRFQTIATMTALKRGYRVFEYGNQDAKSFLGVPANKKGSKDNVVPFVNSTFNLEIPDMHSNGVSDAEITRCSHVGDAIALGYLHANNILRYIRTTEQNKNQ